MIENLKIKNYKSFKSLSLNNLGRVNVIVGPNSSGKTALMEAIFLACGSNPELVLKIRAFRGLNTLSITLDKSGYEALWKDIFNDFDQSKQIEIKLTGTNSFCRSLSISYSKDTKIPVAIDITNKDFAAESISPTVPINFSWKLNSKKKFTAEPIISNNGLAVKFNEPLESLPVGFYTSSQNATHEENARYFSALSVKNLEKKIVDALKSEFSFINNLSVEIWSGTPSIFASIEDVGEKIPLSLVSSGVNKLISILLGIATQRGGVICIDEIENGFYFDRLPSIWKLILEFSKQFNVQIFASTHSWECLKAASDCAVELNSADDFTLIQSINDHDFRVHDGSSFVNAINRHIDVR